MRLHRTGWTILGLIAVLGVASALFLALPAAPTEGDLQPVGLTWVEVQAFNPALADLISGIYRLTGIAYAGFSLLAFAVVVHGWRTQETWAWGAAWLQPATYAMFGVSFILAGNNDLTILYLGLAVVATIALVAARPGEAFMTNDGPPIGIDR